MSQSLGYFNSSLWDTISGEYYRSFTEKSDYFQATEKIEMTLYNK